ncbi:alpha-L-fucosidase, partial [Roseiflexus sp.]
FNDRVIADIIDLFMGVPQQQEYVEYANAHWKELIDRYQPSVLWNDIGYPAAANLAELFSYYYNAVPEGVINDRFTQAATGDGPPDPAAIMQALAQGMLPTPPHFDFRTPEYAVFPDIKIEKWESCRGLGYSFGYNRNETVDDMLSPVELVRSFVDIVSKNGNLLINVGPMGNGTIPPEQAERLEALGSWLSVNGEAIYGSRPWTRAEGTTDSSVGVRFTRQGSDLYAILLDTPPQPAVTLHDLSIPAGASVILLGHGAITAEQHDNGLTVTLPSPLFDAPAYAIKIAGGAGS